MEKAALEKRIINLYVKTATCLPHDVLRALKSALRKERDQRARRILQTMVTNSLLAKKLKKPLCQDTGTPIFYVNANLGYSQKEIAKIIKTATKKATASVPLRPNAVNPLSDSNVGNVPAINFSQGRGLSIDLMLKGGGSENVSSIYQLPNRELEALRDLDGVRRCVLDAIFKAQGKGCPPYVVGVAIGGTIEQVAHVSKMQLLRKLDDKNKNVSLKKSEHRLLKEINSLGIGPLGLGGDTTALAVKMASELRHPASYFVGISISCWSLRRQKS